MNPHTSCVCVLTGLCTGKYDWIMIWWSFKPQSGIATVLDYSAYCYVLLPRPPYYSSPCHSYHTKSLYHPGIIRLRPIISTYLTRSFSHPGISRIRLRTRITDPLSASPLPSGSYCATLSPCRPPPLSILRGTCQVGPKCFLCLLLMKPSLLPASNPLVPLIRCTHF